MSSVKAAVIPNFFFNAKPYQAILFDMDGTLLDNMMIHHEAWRVALAEHGIHLTIDEVKAQIHGVNHEILARLFGDTFNPEQARRFADEKEAAYRRIYAPNISLIAGAMDFLQHAKTLGVPMGIATAAPADNLHFVLKHLPIEGFFTSMKHAADVSRGKPDPQVFELVAQELGFEMQHCLVFEDSVTGAEAASNGGADTVVMTTTHAEQEFQHLSNVVAFAQDYQQLNMALTASGRTCSLD